MTDREIALVLGGLLHDIGKVIYRQGGDRRKHSLSGYEFLKEETGLTDTEVLDCVRYHHADAIRGAQLDKASPAYIIYIADNIASAADRRKNDSEDTGFEISMPLQSVFNILNGNQEEKYYAPGMLEPEEGINFPCEEKRAYDEAFYSKVKTNLTENLRGLEWTPEYINSLLEVLEANLSYVPASTAKGELADISLFDHVKLTAAAAGCIYAYLQEQGEADYRTRLFDKGNDFYGEEAFLLFSMDISGIQDFIYTIASKNALKTLRARSFYLEIMMEHIIDSLLSEMALSRANLIYSGGGHCYILMPNTKQARTLADRYMDRLNHWLMEQFDTALYVAWGCAPCSADSLKNLPEGSYAQIFRQTADEISRRKSSRYTGADILAFNARAQEDYTRECKVCKRIARVDADGVCPVCRAIEQFSRNILEEDFFTVTLERSERALPLPGGYYLVADNRDSLKKKMQQDDCFVRAYSKNRMFTGKHIATKLWVGDYSSGKTFETYAREAEGIDRIGIIRADVDNLGQAFVSGFENPENQNRYVTLSRTATLSRQLSLFFKLHINRILRNGSYSINGGSVGARNVTICYSGGDDVFIVGAWDEVIALAIDIRRAFARYTQGTLTLSAGIGIYSSGYPISAIARETAVLEEKSKSLPQKSAVTVFEDGQSHTVTDEAGRERRISDGTYCWQEFEQLVLGEKYQAIHKFFAVSDERGKHFLYRLLELIRNQSEKINFARYVYLLSRMEPEKGAPPEQKAAYREFSLKMYQWIKSGADCRQLKTAINLYAYLTREKEETEDADQ
ncbi:MAG: type III-A CRISPR-associated protein Cas10/Csm1 [Roseburia sp.]|nr:type III-A CRISPR-associated protein Cas10/Csm1 [Roseburia sp.]